MIKKEILELIEDELGCDIFDYAMENMDDSTDEGYCTECGAYYGVVEPDASGYRCRECGKDAVCSIETLALG